MAANDNKRSVWMIHVGAVVKLIDRFLKKGSVAIGRNALHPVEVGMSGKGGAERMIFKWPIYENDKNPIVMSQNFRLTNGVADDEPVERRLLLTRNHKFGSVPFATRN